MYHIYNEIQTRGAGAAGLRKAFGQALQNGAYAGADKIIDFADTYAAVYANLAKYMAAETTSRKIRPNEPLKWSCNQLIGGGSTKEFKSQYINDNFIKPISSKNSLANKMGLDTFAETIIRRL